LRPSNVDIVIIEPKITTEQKMKNILNDSIVLIHVKGPSISTTTPAKTHIETVSPKACLISVCRVLVKKSHLAESETETKEANNDLQQHFDVTAEAILDQIWVIIDLNLVSSL